MTWSPRPNIPCTFLVLLVALSFFSVDAQHVKLVSPKKGSTTPETTAHIVWEVLNFTASEETGKVRITVNGGLAHESFSLKESMAVAIPHPGIYHFKVELVDARGTQLDIYDDAYAQFGVSPRPLPETWKAANVPEDIMRSAFTDYEWGPREMDAGTLLEEYAALHKKILDPSDTSVPKRFVIYDYNNFGLGNRINGLMTALLVAIVTKRAFVAEMKAVSRFFDRGDGGNGAGIIWNYVSMDDIQKLLPEGLTVDDSWDYEGFGLEMVETLTCADFNATLAENPIIRMNINQWGGPFIASNPYYRRWMYQTFGQDPAGVLFRFIFKLAPFVQKAVDGVKAEWGDRYTVGVQLRRHRRQDGGDPCPRTRVTTNLGERGTTHAYMTHEHQSLYWSCARSLGRKALPTIRDRLANSTAATADAGRPLYYVASDTKPEVDPMATAALGANNVFSLSVDADSYFREDHGYVETGEDRSLQFWAVVELWLLGEADDLIITPASTYGYWAAARTSRVPVTVSRWGKCVRSMTSQPYASPWFLLKWTSCFIKAMHVPEHDMLCPSCIYQECDCHGAVPCASHSDYTNEFVPDYD